MREKEERKSKIVSFKEQSEKTKQKKEKGEMKEEGREGEWKRGGVVSLQTQNQFVLSKSGAEAELLGGDAVLEQQTS